MAKELTWNDIKTGNVVTEAGNFIINKTGDWRTERPVVDKEKCNKCGVCWLFCPDAAIDLNADCCEPDLYHCKGCGICAAVCLNGAIAVIEEEEQYE